MSDLICPFMSCRTTSVNRVEGKPDTITPTVVKCQEGKCAIWDGGNKVCSPLGIISELIRGVEGK